MEILVIILLFLLLFFIQFRFLGKEFVQDCRRKNHGFGRLITVLYEIKDEIKNLNEEPETPVDSSGIYTVSNGQLTKADKMNLKITQKVPLIVKVSDKKGNPAQVDGEIAFSVDNAEVAEIVDQDGVKFLVPKALGAIVVSADADGDLGEGVKPLHFEAAVNVIGGDAETLELQFGTPVDQE